MEGEEKETEEIRAGGKNTSRPATKGEVHHSKSASALSDAHLNLSRRVLEKILATGTSFALHQAIEIRGSR